MERKKTVRRLKAGFNLQLGMAVLLTLSGIALLFSGFWVAPEGEIHHSVLVAFGEVSTFAGALFGVDYSYKMKNSPLNPPKGDLTDQE